MPKFSAGEKIIHDQFVQCGRNAKEWTRKCVLLLPKIEKLEIWKKKGFSSIYEYAAKLAGMNHDKVNEALRILKSVDDKPELMKVIERKGVLAVKPVINVVTKQTELFWAEKAGVMSKNALEVYVKEFRKQFVATDENKNINGLFEMGIDDCHRPRTADDLRKIQTENDCLKSESNIDAEINCLKTELKIQKLVGMYLDPTIIEQLEKLKGRGSWNDLMKRLLALREKKIEEQKPEPVTAENPGNCRELSRYISAKIVNYLIEKYNGLCAFPHCKQPYQIIHHTQRWALKHQHDPDKMVLLCKGHERLFHLGLIENEEGDANDWKIRLEAEKNDPKFEIDRKVQAFRSFG